MSLDDTLRNLIDSYTISIDNGTTDKNSILMQGTITEIKQAFADSGEWIHVNASQETQAAIANTILGNKVMTGQEWYNRFEKELKQEYVNADVSARPLYDWQNHILEAAKRAAGLENQNTKTKQGTPDDTK